LFGGTIKVKNSRKLNKIIYQKQMKIVLPSWQASFRVGKKTI